MKRARRAVGFVAGVLLLNVLFYFALTERGYDRVYSLAFSLCTQVCTLSDGDYSEYAQLERPASKYSLFLWETRRGEPNNADGLEDLLYYLASKTDLRCLVTDLSYAAADCLNRYLNGEEEAFAAFADACPDSEWASPAQRGLLERLREFNDRMPERRRIRLIGIGGSSCGELTIRYLQELCADVENRRKSGETAVLLESVLTAGDCGNLREACLADPTPFRELFGGRYYAFRTALEDSAAPSDDRAEMLTYMAKRLCDEIARDSGGKYFGFIGEDGFTDTLEACDPYVFAKTYRGRILYDRTADEEDSRFGLTERGVYKTDNRFFRYFEAWRRVVCRLNRVDDASYARRDDPDMLLIFVS